MQKIVRAKAMFGRVPESQLFELTLQSLQRQQYGAKERPCANVFAKSGEGTGCLLNCDASLARQPPDKDAQLEGIDRLNSMQPSHRPCLCSSGLGLFQKAVGVVAVWQRQV